MMCMQLIWPIHALCYPQAMVSGRAVERALLPASDAASENLGRSNWSRLRPVRQTFRVVLAGHNAACPGPR